MRSAAHCEKVEANQPPTKKDIHHHQHHQHRHCLQQDSNTCLCLLLGLSGVSQRISHVVCQIFQRKCRYHLRRGSTSRFSYLRHFDHSIIPNNFAHMRLGSCHCSFYMTYCCLSLSFPWTSCGLGVLSSLYLGDLSIPRPDLSTTQTSTVIRRGRCCCHRVPIEESHR